ncbi:MULTISPECIES: hypothetical protein [Bacteria]|uniref:hypothetical protein n=1 Tax=Bacteria TaxID=2 RepID=UPI001FAFC923|nr:MULTISPECIES: hypothetical protein [Bacteria]
MKERLGGVSIGGWRAMQTIQIEGAMMQKRLAAVLLGTALMAGETASARDLPVPADKGWRHAETGVALMAQNAGLARTALTDATQGEFDVAAQYWAPDKSVTATVYIFRPAIADVGLWFDRSQTALETRAEFRNAAPASADPVAFALPGAAAGSALRQTYANASGAYRSTALAVMPLNGWIVAIRMSATTLTADRLDTELQQFIAGVRWPKATAAGTAARLVKPCATPLVFRKAKQVATGGGDLLMSLMLPSLAATEKAKTAAKPDDAPLWCREGDGRTEYGVYRDMRNDQGYTLALYDAGRSISVFPSIMGQIEKTSIYSVSLTDVDGSTSVLPSFNAMPQPKQVWAVLSQGKVQGKAVGKTITLDAKALK